MNFLCSLRGFGRISGSHEFVAQYCGKPKEAVLGEPETTDDSDRATSVERETAHLVQDLEIAV